MRKRSGAGFTVLELLVAMTLFALIAGGAQILLRGILTARQEGQLEAEKLASVQKAVWLMERDVFQMEPGTLRASPSDGYLFQFVARGWRNPLALPRSDRRITAYAVRNGALMRYTQSPVDGGSMRQEQTLLSNVSNFTYQAVPGAIELRFETRDFGTVRRVIEVPG